jgi:hypothetical protein
MFGWMNHPALEIIRLRGTQKVAMVSLLSALAIATDYAMLPLANIKLMDTVVFVSGLVFGMGVGASVGGLTWLVYGSVNPLGSDSGLLLIILIMSEMVYAFLGSIARRSFSEGMGAPTKSVYWGCLGLIGAFFYDLVTIMVPTMLAGASIRVAAASLVLAVPFMLAHEVSDFVFFATVGPLLVSTILKVVKPRISKRSTVMLPNDHTHHVGRGASSS